MNKVLFEVRDRVAHVTLNRPASMNAVDGGTEQQLQAIWSAIEADRGVRMVVLTGAGDRAFCAGVDMKHSEHQTGLEYWAAPRPGGFGGIALRQTLDVPVLARVNGVALGGGFEMVLGCDIVVACEDAGFGLPEPRVGRLPLDGGMTLLQRQIAFVPFCGTDDLTRSHFETQDSIELGQPLGANRDYQSGFLNRLVGVLGGAQPIAFTDQLPIVLRGDKDVPNMALRSIGSLFVGGVVGAVLIGTLLWWLTPFRPWQSAVLSLIIALMGFCGGLVMSAIKRDRGVKDYGSMIPGHGGLMDRIDSLCFAAPVFFHLTRYHFT